MFPYFDNDIGSYTALYEYIAGCWEVLGCRTRLATVGFSRHHESLATMHRRIVSDLQPHLAGVRLSVTPYTDGWVQATHALNRAEFAKDVEHFLRIYRDVYEARSGMERGDSLAIEVRQTPQIGVDQDAPQSFLVSGDTWAVRSGPFVVIGEFGGPPFLLPECRLITADRDGTQYSVPPTPAELRIHDDFARMSVSALKSYLRHGGSPIDAYRKDVILYRFANEEGPYLAIDPDFDDRGFHALQVYEKTPMRPTGGYLDSERPLLSEILAVKRAYGLSRRDQFVDATWDDVLRVRQHLVSAASRWAPVFKRRAQFISSEILPIYDLAVESLRRAGYSASAVFDRTFFIDTGNIVNQGRARGLFRGLARKRDMPLTPRQELGYGAVCDSADRGLVWRLSPMLGLAHRSERGGKNPMGNGGSFLAEELDPEHLRPRIRGTQRPLRQYFVGGPGGSLMPYAEGIRLNLLPGSVRSDA
jgi:hypothetical protein